MQELIQTRKIMEDERKQIILEVLADKYCKHILHSTMDTPKSAMEISSDEKLKNDDINFIEQQFNVSLVIYGLKLLTDFSGPFII